jgi:hypothetical protein
MVLFGIKSQSYSVLRALVAKFFFAPGVLFFSLHTAILSRKNQVMDEKVF